MDTLQLVQQLKEQVFEHFYLTNPELELVAGGWGMINPDLSVSERNYAY